MYDGINGNIRYLTVKTILGFCAIAIFVGFDPLKSEDSHTLMRSMTK